LFIDSKKRKKNEPTYLKDFCVYSKTGAQSSINASDHIMTNEEQKIEYWKTNAYFRVLDCIIVGMKKRFSIESMSIGISIDNFFKLNYKESLVFIEKYEVSNIWTVYHLHIYFIC